MGPLFLTEDDVRSVVSVPETINALRDAFLDQHRGAAAVNPRQRLRIPGITLHMLAGAIPGYFGYKAYTSAATGTRFYFHLFDAKSSEMLAIMQADSLGQLRTGAATGLATALLASPSADTAVLFGAGWQAESQLLAMCAAQIGRAHV